MINYNDDAMNEAFEDFFNSAKVYAYISTAIATTMVTADTYYFFNSTITNKIIEGFELNGGIKLTANDGDFEIEFNTSGEAGSTAKITIAVAKNATFDETTGEMLTGTILDGSPSGHFTSTQGILTTYINLHSLSGESLVTNNTLSLVIKSSTNNNTFTPDNGCASIHKFH